MPAWFRPASEASCRRNGPGTIGPERTRPTVNPEDRGGASFLQRAGAGIERGTSRQYIIYQQDAQVVNLQAFARRVGATYRLPMLAAREHQLRRTRLRAHQRSSRVSDPGAWPAAAQSIPPGCSRARAAGPRCSGTGTTTSARHSSGARRTISASRAANQSPSHVTSSYFSSRMASVSASL